MATPKSAGKDISYLSNQVAEANERAAKQLDSVREGLHGKISDHIDALTATLVELNRTTQASIALAQEERVRFAEKLSTQLDTLAQARTDLMVRLSNDTLAAINAGSVRQTLENDKIREEIENVRRDFWKLFFKSLWSSIKGLF